MQKPKFPNPVIVFEKNHKDSTETTPQIYAKNT
jgi:hypothetical protein